MWRVTASMWNKQLLVNDKGLFPSFGDGKHLIMNYRIFLYMIVILNCCDLYEIYIVFLMSRVIESLLMKGFIFSLWLTFGPSLAQHSMSWSSKSVVLVHHAVGTFCC